jgi:CubicO group peptidase (beta-lactamase class C family)
MDRVFRFGGAAGVRINTKAIDGWAARVLDTGMAPAAAVALTDRERTFVSRTYGAAAPGAQWPIASIGKSFTAVIALQLAEEGLLEPDAPVTDYDPWLSVRSHHAASPAQIASSDLAPASNYDVIALTATETGFACVGHRAVGVVREAVTGRPYAALVQQRVLDRLDMRASSPVIVHETRRLLPAGNVPSTATARGSAITAWRSPRGSNPPRPTAVCAVARRTWPPICGRYGPKASCSRPRALPP